MKQHSTIAPSVDASTPAARRALADWLRAHDYGDDFVDAILTHVARENTVDDAPDLCAEDAAAAEAVYVAAFEPVSLDSADWDEEDDHLTPDDALPLYRRRLELRFFELPDWQEQAPPAAVAPVVVPDAPDFHVTQQPGYWESLAAAGITPLPAICGGSDDVPPPYEPTPEDWAEYRRMFDRIDQVDVKPPAPNRYSPGALIAFRNAAWGV